ncbi:hypothetical protein OG229_21145 [Streptomyces platensis]|nr:hypothetical protein OG229_21145 [Streptomyces platensis]
MAGKPRPGHHPAPGTDVPVTATGEITVAQDDFRADAPPAVMAG